MCLSTLEMLRRLLFELGLLFENGILIVFGLFGVFLVWFFSILKTVEDACVLLKYSMEAC